MYDIPMIIDGRALAEKLYAELAKERESLGDISLGILVGDESPVTSSYLRIKERAAQRLGVQVVFRHLLPQATTADAVALIKELIETCDGVIPQLPLQSQIDTQAVRNAIPKEKDVDVLSDEADAGFKKGTWPIVSPVPSAFKFILEHEGVSVEEKKVVVVGQGRLVGKPAAALFAQLGAEVTSLEKGDDIRTHTHDADIIILGAGSPGLLTEDMIKNGAIVLDAGTSELGDKVVGDAAPSIATKCALFTPVPGGVGPVAIAMIFRNLFRLTSLQNNT